MVAAVGERTRPSAELGRVSPSISILFCQTHRDSSRTLRSLSSGYKTNVEFDEIENNRRSLKISQCFKKNVHIA